MGLNYNLILTGDQKHLLMVRVESSVEQMPQEMMNFPAACDV